MVAYSCKRMATFFCSMVTTQKGKPAGVETVEVVMGTGSSPDHALP
jgi:hypothetical protein